MPRSRPGERLADRLTGRLAERPERHPRPEAPSGDAEAAPAADPLGELGRADTPEAVLAAVARPGAGELPVPIRDLVERIQRETDRWARATTRRRRSAGPRGAQERPAAGSPEVAGPVPDERMERLVRRLVQLVHLAETDRRRHEARRRVRMAEASQEAVQEAAPRAGAEAAAGEEPPDLEALGRQVLEAMTRILESRQQRRQEEPDVRDVQW